MKIHTCYKAACIGGNAIPFIINTVGRRYDAHTVECCNAVTEEEHRAEVVSTQKDSP